MTLRCVAICALLLAAYAPGIVAAGEAIGCFNRGELGTCTREALPHVEFKSVVLQFVDPNETGLGESLARVLWREILESISDLRGAGVILAYDRAGEIERALGESDIGRFLEREYHDAASRIADQQDVQMSIWGAVLEDGDELFVQTFLTLRQTADEPWTTLRLNMERPEPLNLKAFLGRERINLPPIRRTRRELFGRWVVTRCALRAGCPEGVALRDGPSNDAAIVAHVPVGSQLHVVDMQRQWIKLRPVGSGRRDGGRGEARWINVYHVEMFPEHVSFFTRRNVNLRAAPGGRRHASVDLDGRYRVLNAARHGRYGEPWYEIATEGLRGWVAGRLVNRRTYLFPAVHLIAGLYRYGRGEYSKAVKEFEAFLATTPEQENVTRAAALKFLAASRVAGRPGISGRVDQALQDLTAAARLTPFDADVFTLRSLVHAGSGRHLEPAILDLKRALELDRRDPGALRLLQDMTIASRTAGLGALGPGQATRRVTTEFELLQRTYGRGERLEGP